MDNLEMLPAFKKDQISLFKSGSRMGFEKLYDTFSPSLFGLICCIAPDDQSAKTILADCFLKIWKHRSEYDPEEQSIFVWLIHHARNAALEASNKSENFMEENVLLAKIKLKNSLKVAHDSNSHNQIFELMYVYGKTRKQVCEMLKTSEPNVTEKLKCALSALTGRKLI